MKNILRFSMPTAIATGLVISLSVPDAVQAQNAFSEGDVDCTKPQMEQFSMNYCSAKESAQAEDRLNTLVQAILKQFDQSSQKHFAKGDQRSQKYFAKGKQALQQSQDAWITYRDKQCVWEAFAYEGGSMQPMVRSGCRNSLALKRIDRICVNDLTGVSVSCAALRQHDRPKQGTPPSGSSSK